MQIEKYSKIKNSRVRKDAIILQLDKYKDTKGKV